MDQTIQKTKFDLEERTTTFAKRVIILCKSLKQNVITIDIIRQLLRSAGSVGANYREANDALGKKDFILRMRIARKEAKETIHWLELLIEACDPDANSKIQPLIQECTEIRNILSSIIKKIDPS